MSKLSYSLLGERPTAAPDYYVVIQALSSDQKDELEKLDKKVKKEEISKDSKEYKRHQLLASADLARHLAFLLKECEMERSQLRSELQVRDQVIGQLQATEAKAKEDLSSFEMVVKQLTSQLEAGQKEIESLKIRHEEEKDDMQTAVENLEEQNDSFVQEIRRLKKDLRETTQELTEAGKMRESFEAMELNQPPDPQMASTAIHGRQTGSFGFMKQAQNNTGFSQNMTGCSMSSPLKMKPLEIKRFEGAPGEWKNFWNAFQLVYGTNAQLSDGNRLTCLKSNLGGQALKRVAYLDDTDDGYKEAVRDLERAYSSTAVKNAEATEMIEAAPEVITTDDLVNFYTEVKSGVCKLTNPATADVLVPRVSKKLPHDMRVAMAQRTKKAIGSLTMKEFLQEVQFEMEVREGERKIQMPNTVQHTSSLAASTSSGTSPTKKTGTKKKKPCPFCKGNHYPTHCFQVSDHHARMKVVESNKLCKVCLMANHKTEQCLQGKRGFTCLVCAGKHHPAIHGCFEKAAKGAQ